MSALSRKHPRISLVIQRGRFKYFDQCFEEMLVFAPPSDGDSNRGIESRLDPRLDDDATPHELLRKHWLERPVSMKIKLAREGATRKPKLRSRLSLSMLALIEARSSRVESTTERKCSLSFNAARAAA